MEEYTQITLDQWTQWKEDIRRKLGETAGNFVYIGYRLKQIRDSGMYDGAADIFEFAEKEYGLGKSTVSRFIAINEKYSEGGNSLELKEEFRGFSSSKLAEMLTLPDNEIQLITEKTTIREIRELKSFNAQEAEELGEAAGSVQEQERTPLEKCMVDFFKVRKEMLNGVMKHLEADPPEYKQAAELMAPSGQASHKKGIVFLFLYDWNTGIKYKLMTEPEPVAMSWTEFLNTIYHIFGACDQMDVWGDFYREQESTKEEPEKTVPAQSIQGSEAVATSQQEQEEEHENKEPEAAGLETEKGSAEDNEKPVETEPHVGGTGDDGSEEGESGTVWGMDGEGRTEAEADTADDRGSREDGTENAGETAEGEDGRLKDKEEPEQTGNGVQEDNREQEAYDQQIEKYHKEITKKAVEIAGSLNTKDLKSLGEYRRDMGNLKILETMLKQMTDYMERKEAMEYEE